MPKKQTIHFVVPYPLGEAPSQRFRFEQYVAYLQENGCEIRFHSFHSKNSWKRLYHSGKFIQKGLDLSWNFLRRWFLLFQLIGAKKIFIHREMAHIGPPIFEWILAKILRKKYILDFDDAIWIPNYSAANARFQRLKCYWKTKYVIRWAHQVTAGNDYLVHYAQQFNTNVQLIPTTIDTENHHTAKVDHQQEKLVIGWTGTHSTMHYLDAIVPILMDLEKEFDFEFRVISNAKPAYQLKSLRFTPWKLETEIADLATFHIGIMPLVADQWSAGKCGFKALQYMSLGTVAVVSPVGVNGTIVQHLENGMIAASPEDWKNQLRTLLKDPELRSKLGANARASIEKEWSVKRWKLDYLGLFVD